MNIDGLSEATLEKFLAKGFLHTYADLFHLDRYKEQITQMDRFGKNPSPTSPKVLKTRGTQLSHALFTVLASLISEIANAKMI